LPQKVKIRNCKTDYNLPVVLYECETWSLTLREERADNIKEHGAEENIREKNRD
jgi:hypothetical protein